MADFIDITGQRFGRLVAIEYVRAKKRWRCKCDCGQERLVVGWSLRHGHQQSCSCLSREKARAGNWGWGIRREVTCKPGRKFGRLTLIERAGYVGTVPYWKVRCDCGTELVVAATHFYRTDQPNMSCGCYRKEWEAAQKAATAAKKAAKAALPRMKMGRPIRFPIDPDIAALSVSRQRKLQLQWKRLGRCQTCGEALSSHKGRCERHSAKPHSWPTAPCPKCGVTCRNKGEAAKHCRRAQRGRPKSRPSRFVDALAALHRQYQTDPLAHPTNR